MVVNSGSSTKVVIVVVITARYSKSASTMAISPSNSSERFVTGKGVSVAVDGLS